MTGSSSSNNHASRKPDCTFRPCLVLERTLGQSRKQDAKAYLMRCTSRQREMGMPPKGGCAPCIPTPGGRDKGYQWVEVQIPEGVAPGETFPHLNHNGRYMMTVTVPDDMPDGTEILQVEIGNKCKRTERERHRSAARQATTVECATARCNASDERATDERADTERAAARGAIAERATAEARRLAAEIAQRSDEHSAADGSRQVLGGGCASFKLVGVLGPNIEH